MRKILLSVLVLTIIIPFVSLAQTSDRTLLQSLWNQLLQLQTIVTQLLAKQGTTSQPTTTTTWQTYRFNAGDFPGMSYLAFEIKYPASWSYKKMSGNVEYIAFYPKAIQNELEVGAMITNAPIVLNMSENNMTGAVSNNSQKHKNFVTPNGEIRAYLGLANSKYQKEFDEMAKSFVFQNTTNPQTGNATLKISCNNDGCNTTDVQSTRNNFYVKATNGKTVKVLIDLETRLRHVRGVDSETSGTVEDIMKWADFYPLIENKPRLGMPFSATIYGDWVNQDTFKANWIKWSIG